MDNAPWVFCLIRLSAQNLLWRHKHGPVFLLQQRSRQPTLPPYSNRTLHHPSFMPQYMAAAFAHHHTDFTNQTGESVFTHMSVFKVSAERPSSTLFPSPSQHPSRVLLHWSHHGLWDQDPQHSQWAEGKWTVAMDTLIHTFNNLGS